MNAEQQTFLDCGLFNGIEEGAIATIANAHTLKHYNTGDHLIQKGVIPPSLFIIHAGRVGIYNEDVLLTELNSGACIGESMIANAVATAASTAMTDVEAFTITRDEFFALTDRYPRIVQNLFALTVERLRASNEISLQEARRKEAVLRQMVDERTKELQQTLKELKHTQEFRDQFLANMSHEIRTPMNAIVGLTNLLVKTQLDQQQEKYLSVIKKSGDNLLVIINDILDLSKIEAGKMELEHYTFSLHNTLEQLITMLRVRAEQKNIELKLQFADQVPDYVKGDETRLTQILVNLAGNAIKFTEKGSVTIEVSAERGDDNTALITFSVNDTGIGIPEDKLEAIFESFGQAASDTTRKFGGTGLGLSISRQLVELHGGVLRVSSVFGEGSKFYFSIPYPVSEKPEVVLETADEADFDLSGKKVLLIEDNEFNQMVAVDTIELLFPGIVIDVASNARTAIANASANDYALILMDIQLPDGNGYEVTRFIRKELPIPRNKVPICALTASVTEARVKACMDAGMNDFMFKPFTHQLLKDTFRKWIGVNQGG